MAPFTVAGRPVEHVAVLLAPGERCEVIVDFAAFHPYTFTSDLHHPVHVHLDPFQVLTRRGDRTGPYDGGWKDTVHICPSESVVVAVRFTDYPGRYLLHCHNLEHEDMAVMAVFRTG